MSESLFQVIKTEDGDYKWSLFDEHGIEVEIRAGSVPGLRQKKGNGWLEEAVQAGLKALYERQQAASR